jgi:hypothetical protein
LVNSSVKKIKPAFAGKCIALAVACVGKFSDQEQGGTHLLVLLA